MNTAGNTSASASPLQLQSVSSSSHGLVPPAPCSARNSIQLHSSLLHSPPQRLRRFVSSPPSISLIDSHGVPYSGRVRTNSSSPRALGVSRSDEEAFPAFSLDAVAAEAEAKANKMSPEELRSAILDLRTRIRMQRNTILREREDVEKLQEGMRETYVVAEKEGESITNQLMRRVAKVRHQKGLLEARLRKEEKLKEEQEKKLLDLKSSSISLEMRLRREEEEILASMSEQLRQLQEQRKNLESLLLRHSSLQQLQEFVNHLQIQSTVSDVGSGVAEGDGFGPLSAGNGALQFAPTATATTGSCPGFPVAGGAEGVVTEVTDISTIRPPQCLSESVHSHEMLQYLRREVAVVEAIQRDAVERGERYIERRHKIERRISQAELERRGPGVEGPSCTEEEDDRKAV
ncbi:hypothetical protein ERJ75_001319300 [Trypanosoma vivax]|uniref:Uncharacterized protein n=1 Tax=Trypanosoma vivax (strain Y486) TaxID=1055687 RepID=G0U0W1_TRYVY|nr:hypothetical protein ERJ75_001319300 [Trypanosoma vivax]CCC49714.1 conserved hypothetical protein [Trypanosoma vivax Y486]